MAENTKVLAFDFGASSGRAMLFQFDGEKITIEDLQSVFKSINACLQRIIRHRFVAILFGTAYKSSCNQ